ncbi:MAG TPA: very short patch repair endonuclease [Bryobacteraceae bacterium]|nr:very short patch repair endonuclease [Bryobacteraceae bacterium]
MDRITNEARSENMRRIKSKDSTPELTVRRLVHRLGYRYRLHDHKLPGRPDLIFPGRRKIIFVHGCFWHQHKRCTLSHTPKSRQYYWQPKLERNTARDRAHRRTLATMGWKTLVIWECETKATSALSKRLQDFLR